jgi:hypothetical protein
MGTQEAVNFFEARRICKKQPRSWKNLYKTKTVEMLEDLLVLFHPIFFLRITQYNIDAHNARTLTSYEHTYTNPTPMSTSEGLIWQISRFTKSSQAPRCRRGHRLSLKHSVDKFWNKFRKIRTPMPSRELDFP